MKKRVISTLIMLSIIIPIVVFSSVTTYSDGFNNLGYEVTHYIFAILLYLVTAFALQEGYNALLKDKISNKNLFEFIKWIFSILLPILPLITYAIANGGMNESQFLLFFIVTFTLNLISALVLHFSKVDDFTVGTIFLINLFVMMWSFNYQLIQRGETLGWQMFFYLTIICISVDSFGLIFGKNFGKKKVAPNISPNKTIEGSIGGILSSTILATTWMMVFNLDNNFFGISQNEIGLGILYSALLSFALSLISFSGDLLFSYFKRKNNIKDYSNLIPGHGGLLDRLDSHIVVNSVMIIPIYLSYSIL